MKTLAKVETDKHAFKERDEDLMLLQAILNGSGTRNPRVGCAGIIRRGEDVLMGQRNKEPNRGLWVLPGGGVEFGETFAETLRRELAEEAGIDVEIDGIFEISELIRPPNEH